jgi:hypothetical protein
VDAADQRGAVVTFWAYYRSICVRAWRDTVAFLKAHVLVGLVTAVATAVVIYWVSVDMGEPFNVRVAVYAAVVAAAMVGLLAFAGNLTAAPWRLHEEQAARLLAFERRPDVTRLVELRERGVIDLLNRRPVPQSEEDLASLQSDVGAWEAETAVELEKSATKADASSFRVLGPFDAPWPGGLTVYTHEMAMLTERLDRLTDIIRRIEGGAGR